MNIETKLRKLARSSYWQNLYKASKENSGIHLFENINNFTYLQIRFLYWLAIYDILYDELARQESDFLTENVIENDERTDAYLAYRHQKTKYEWKKYRQEEKARKMKDKHPKKHNKGNMTLIDVDLRSE